METVTDSEMENRGETCKRERAPYLVVDYGEQLVSDIADVRDELHKEYCDLKTMELYARAQILSVIERVHLLWEILRTFMLFIITVVSGMLAAIIFQVVFPTYLAEFCFTSCFGMTLVVGFFTLNPLMEAVNTYQKHAYYTPNFIECHCDVCSVREKKRNCQDTKNREEADKDDEVMPGDFSATPESEPNVEQGNGDQSIPVAETLSGADY